MVLHAPTANRPFFDGREDEVFHAKADRNHEEQASEYICDFQRACGWAFPSVLRNALMVTAFFCLAPTIESAPEHVYHASMMRNFHCSGRRMREPVLESASLS
jgi:hypothetical protein